MLKKSKLLFYFKHLVLMSTTNKIRLALTSIGIFIAVFLFSTGTVLTNSYYAGLMKTITEMKDNTVVIESSKDPADVKSEISKVSSAISVDSLSLYQKKTIFSTSIGSGQYLNVFADIHGISSLNSLMPVMTDDKQMLPVNSQLVRGRLISQTDIQSNANVVVIDELTEMILFPYGNSLGQLITVDVGANGMQVGSSNPLPKLQLEIIGVVRNPYVSETRKLQLQRDINQSESRINLDTSIYIPITTFSTNYADEMVRRYYIYEFDQSSDYENFVANMNSVVKINSMRSERYDFSTKDMLMSEQQQDLSNTKFLINIISLILCIISGISIMSVIFFSVKERIPEIGVRKAFGASKLDIAFQFVFEMVVIAFFSSIVAVCLSFFACKFAENYLTTQLYMAFTVSVPLAQLALPILIGIIEVIICSIIPSLYAANIKVTDSLRFE